MNANIYRIPSRTDNVIPIGQPRDYPEAVDLYAAPELILTSCATVAARPWIVLPMPWEAATSCWFTWALLVVRCLLLGVRFAGRCCRERRCRQAARGAGAD
jgi:hypothetical protein